MEKQEMQERAQAVMDRLVADIQAHAAEIVSITLAGKIAVFVFEPGETATLRHFGWNGNNPVFAMSPELGTAVAIDPVTFNWINRQTGPARIFVFIHEGTLLVNFDLDQGFSLEPGSTDAEQAHLVN